MAGYRDLTATPNPEDDIIVDLRSVLDPLLQMEDVSDLLDDAVEADLVSFIKALSDVSHSRISQRYDAWLEADRAHDVYVPPETTRFREKAVISDTRAIADTVLTYLMAALGGRNPMFQLEGLDRNSRTQAAILERLLHQHMRRTQGEARLAQHLLDNIRYGMAPTKIIWDDANRTNHIINADPRRCFPDPRVNGQDFDKSQFVIFTDYASTSALIASGLYPKLKKYPALRSTKVAQRATTGWSAHEYIKERARGLNIAPMGAGASGSSTFSVGGASATATSDNASRDFRLGDARVIDECWFRLNGYEIGAPQIDTIWLVATIIDESTVIRLQLNPYGRSFPASLGGFYLDRHKAFSQSLYDVMLPLHDIATWLLRSRIDNVQAALNNLIFADPTQVNIADLIDRNPWGLVKALPGADLSSGLRIEAIPDVTQSHWSDIGALSDLKQRLSAASDAQQGMPTADGIRSATEIARLTQLGSQRLGVLSRIMSGTSIRPMVRMMVSNLQDALEYSGSIRLDPNDQPGVLATKIQDGYLDFEARDLEGNIDYLVVDGTLPVEPTRSPETWMNILAMMDQTGLGEEYKLGKIAEEGIKAMGVPDLDQFKITQEEAQMGLTPSQMLRRAELMRGSSAPGADNNGGRSAIEGAAGSAASRSPAMNQANQRVMPREQIDREVERGNLIPAGPR